MYPATAPMRNPRSIASSAGAGILAGGAVGAGLAVGASAINGSLDHNLEPVLWVAGGVVGAFVGAVAGFFVYANRQ